jgi:hypothetical protein
MRQMANIWDKLSFGETQSCSLKALNEYLSCGCLLSFEPLPFLPERQCSIASKLKSYENLCSDFIN